MLVRSTVSVVVVALGIGLTACSTAAEEPEEMGSSSENLERNLDANVDFLVQAGWRVAMTEETKDAIPAAKLAAEERSKAGGAASLSFRKIPFFHPDDAKLHGHILVLDSATREAVLAPANQETQEALFAMDEDAARAEAAASTESTAESTATEPDDALDTGLGTQTLRLLDSDTVCTPAGRDCGGRYTCCAKNVKCEKSPRFGRSRCLGPLWGVSYATKRSRAAAVCTALGMVPFQTFVRNRSGFSSEGLGTEMMWTGAGVNYPLYARANNDAWVCGLPNKNGKAGLPLCVTPGECTAPK